MQILRVLADAPDFRVGHDHHDIDIVFPGTVVRMDRHSEDVVAIDVVFYADFKIWSADFGLQCNQLLFVVMRER